MNFGGETRKLLETERFNSCTVQEEQVRRKGSACAQKTSVGGLELLSTSRPFLQRKLIAMATEMIDFFGVHCWMHFLGNKRTRPTPLAFATQTCQLLINFRMLSERRFALLLSLLLLWSAVAESSNRYSGVNSKE